VLFIEGAGTRRGHKSNDNPAGSAISRKRSRTRRGRAPPPPTPFRPARVLPRPRSVKKGSRRALSRVSDADVLSAKMAG